MTNSVYQENQKQQIKLFWDYLGLEPKNIPEKYDYSSYLVMWYLITKFIPKITINTAEQFFEPEKDYAEAGLGTDNGKYRHEVLNANIVMPTTGTVIDYRIKPETIDVHNWPWYSKTQSYVSIHDTNIGFDVNSIDTSKLLVEYWERDAIAEYLNMLLQWSKNGSYGSTPKQDRWPSAYISKTTHTRRPYTFSFNMDNVHIDTIVELFKLNTPKFTRPYSDTLSTSICNGHISYYKSDINKPGYLYIYFNLPPKPNYVCCNGVTLEMDQKIANALQIQNWHELSHKAQHNPKILLFSSQQEQPVELSRPGLFRKIFPKWQRVK